MCRWDAVFYILSQVGGGLLAVYTMQGLMGDLLTAAPVNSAVTIPGKPGIWAAAGTEFAIAFITMLMILFMSDQNKLKIYTRLIASCFVFAWVIIAGPISGFGMNPARSFASALPSNIWTAFWIYVFMPVFAMLLAAEFFLFIKKVTMKKSVRIIAVFLFAGSIHLPVDAQTKKVDAIGITVSEMDRSVKFYSEILGFKKISDTEVYGNSYEELQNLFGLRMRIVRMQLGDEFIELTDYLTSGGRSIPEDAKSNDLFFQHIAIVVSDMDRAYLLLKEKKVEHVSTGPQTIPVSNAAAAGVKAFYFHDPDRHNLELIYFPKGKGQAKWQQSNGKLFLGIDHTAIGVSNTEKGLNFYEGILGIMRKGDSWNMGMEQAHLNFVENASLHITGLRAAEGPGIEFLEYLQPGPGRAYPVDSKTDDIWHWQTALIVDDAGELFDQLKGTAYQIVSKSLVTLKGHDGLQIRAFIVRDGDGHAMLIKEKAK